MKEQRSTRQRKLVFDAVQAHSDHPSADQIYLEARGKDPKISRGTVYRNLNLLVHNHQIRHVRLPGLDRFDWRVEPHYHLLCLGCGRVCDASIPYRAELDKTLAEQTGYEISSHRMIFEGLCPDCRQKRENAEK